MQLSLKGASPVAALKNPYIKAFEEHPKNFGTTAVAFQRARLCRKRILDLGCGNGHFLERRLSESPSTFGLGIDLRFKRLFRSSEKLADFPHGGCLHMDIRDFLRESPDQFWSELWVQFPDPWPKDRHAKNRMITAEFFFQVFRTLQVGGRFCFRSDAIAYWKLLQDLQSRHRLFGIAIYQGSDRFESEPSTLFRETFSKKRQRVFSVEFRRTH